MFRRLLFHLFRRFSSAAHRYGRRLTDAGRLLVIGVVMTAIFGLDIEVTLIYQLFVFLFVLLVLAMLFAPFFNPSLTVERLLPRFGTVGDPFQYEVVVSNRGKRFQRDLKLFEDLADPRLTFEMFQTIPEPGEQRRNRFDRMVGFYRFSWLTARNRGLAIDPGRLPLLPPGQKTTVKMSATPLRRGVIRLLGLTVARGDPFNLFLAFHRLDLPENVLILPKRYRIPNHFNLPGGRQYQQGGETLAASVGESEEFVSMRDYREGDSLRHIHWPSWAKSGKPVVKEFQEEYFTRHGVILDTFIGDSEPVFEEAVSIAASFAATLDEGDSLLDLMFVSPRAFRFTAGRGLAHGEQMLEILAAVTPRLDKPFSELTALVLNHAAALSGLLLLFIAWDEERQDLVRKLTAMGIPLFVLLVVEPGSEAPLDRTALGNHPQRLIRLEAGRIQEGLDRL